jgi:hypothetical protein
LSVGLDEAGSLTLPGFEFFVFDIAHPLIPVPNPPVAPEHRPGHAAVTVRPGKSLRFQHVALRHENRLNTMPLLRRRGAPKASGRRRQRCIEPEALRFKAFFRSCELRERRPAGHAGRAGPATEVALPARHRREPPLHPPPPDWRRAVANGPTSGLACVSAYSPSSALASRAIAATSLRAWKQVNADHAVELHRHRQGKPGGRSDRRFCRDLVGRTAGGGENNDGTGSRSPRPAAATLARRLCRSASTHQQGKPQAGLIADAAGDLFGTTEVPPLAGGGSGALAAGSDLLKGPITRTVRERTAGF